MKKLVNKVELEFFQDDSTGDYGLAHKNAIDCETPFNAFWNGIGIFHDVFEHYFEDNHKYFKGENSFNIGGEMAAMGHAMYYYYTLGLYNRTLNPNSRYSFWETCQATTLNEIEEAINSGWCMYGHTLNSCVYKQKLTGNHDLESMIDEFVSSVSKLKKEADLPEDENEREFALTYLESLSTTKVRDLHRYGYRMAEKLVPDNEENRIELANFLEFWETFTKKNSAEEMQNHFRGITFEIYHNEDKEIFWLATFHPLEWNVEDYVINSHTRYVPDINDVLIDMYDIEEEEEILN